MSDADNSAPTALAEELASALADWELTAFVRENSDRILTALSSAPAEFHMGGAAAALAITEPMQSAPADVRALRNAATDALSGWQYIRRRYGDLEGVGWERVETALTAALERTAK